MDNPLEIPQINKFGACLRRPSRKLNMPARTRNPNQKGGLLRLPVGKGLLQGAGHTPGAHTPTAIRRVNVVGPGNRTGGKGGGGRHPVRGRPVARPIDRADLKAVFAPVVQACDRVRLGAGTRPRDGGPAGTAPDACLVVADLVARDRAAWPGPRKLHLSIPRRRRQIRRRSRSDGPAGRGCHPVRGRPVARPIDRADLEAVVAPIIQARDRVRLGAGTRTRDGHPAGTAPGPCFVVADLVACNCTAWPGPRKFDLDVACCRRQIRRGGEKDRRSIVIILDREGEFPGGPAVPATKEMDGLVRFVPRVAEDANRPGALGLAFGDRDGASVRKTVIGTRRQRWGATRAGGRARVKVRRNRERKARRGRLAERGGDRHLRRAGIPLGDRR